jgi:hypothetical protein
LPRGHEVASCGAEVSEADKFRDAKELGGLIGACGEQVTGFGLPPYPAGLWILHAKYEVEAGGNEDFSFISEAVAERDFLVCSASFSDQAFDAGEADAVLLRERLLERACLVLAHDGGAICTGQAAVKSPGFAV